MDTSTSILVFAPLLLAGIASLLAAEEATSQAGVRVWDRLGLPLRHPCRPLILSEKKVRP